MTDTIVCPRCNFEIEVADALSARLRERVCEQVDAEFREKHRVLADLEKSLQDRQKHLETSQAALEQELADRVTVKHAQLEKDAEARAFEKTALQLTTLETELTATRSKLNETQETELQLRHARLQLEDEKRELELTVARTLDEERARIRDDAKREADEQHHLNEADRDNFGV